MTEPLFHEGRTVFVRAIPPVQTYRVLDAEGNEVMVTSSLSFLNYYMDRHPTCTSEEVTS